MAKKTTETETAATPESAPAEAEVTLIALPEVQFKVKEGFGEISQMLGSKPFLCVEGELYDCTRGEWAALSQSGCFDLVE